MESDHDCEQEGSRQTTVCSGSHYAHIDTNLE